MTTFAETVEAIQGKTGTRGFGAKKRAAGEIIAKDIATEMGKLDPAVSGIASQILSDLSLETAAVSQATDPEELKAVSQRLQESRKKMLDAIGKDSYNGVNLFEGTEPIKSAPSPGESITPSSPLSGRGSKDAGVNIDGLMSTVGRNWGKLAKGK